MMNNFITEYNSSLNFLVHESQSYTALFSHNDWFGHWYMIVISHWQYAKLGRKHWCVFDGCVCSLESSNTRLLLSGDRVSLGCSDGRFLMSPLFSHIMPPLTLWYRTGVTELRKDWPFVQLRFSWMIFDLFFDEEGFPSTRKNLYFKNWRTCFWAITECSD